MRKIREVVRLSWSKGLSARHVAQSCSLARSTVTEYCERARKANLNWPLPDDLDEATLEQMLFPPSALVAPGKRNMPPFTYLHKELKRKSVTMQLLWEEYKAAELSGIRNGTTMAGEVAGT